MQQRPQMNAQKSRERSWVEQDLDPPEQQPDAYDQPDSRPTSAEDIIAQRHQYPQAGAAYLTGDGNCGQDAAQGGGNGNGQGAGSGAIGSGYWQWQWQ